MSLEFTKGQIEHLVNDISEIRKDIRLNTDDLTAQRKTLEEHIRRTELLEKNTTPVVGAYNDGKVLIKYIKYIKWPAVAVALYLGAPELIIKLIMGFF